MNYHTGSATLDHHLQAHEADIRKFVYFFFAAMVFVAAGLLLRPSIQRAFSSSSEGIGSGFESAAVPTAIGQAAPVMTVPDQFAPAAPAEAGVAPISADTRTLQFARMEIHRYGGLIPVLTSRMERESNSQSYEKMKSSIEALISTVAATELASNRLRSLTEAPATASRLARLPFAREHLRENMLAMQDAGQTAVSAFIDADNEASNRRGTTPVAVYKDQLFNESRTGQ